MKKFDIKILNEKEIVEKWNEYCRANSYDDDEIHTMHSFKDFALTWYGSPDHEGVDANSIADLVEQLRDYDGEEYYYWCNGNACWFNDPTGEDGPISWSEFQAWLDEEYGEETDEEDE